MSTAVDIDQVHFAYSAVPTLSDVTLRIEQGEFLGIVGPNAGGKSTLLKIILGLLRPQAGRVLVFGQAPQLARQAIGYVPQYPPFARDFPISVAQVVRMGLDRGGLWPQWRQGDEGDRIQSALEEVEAADLAARQIGSLSGGQLQRVLMARALVSQPQLMILDEPTANIDHRLEGEIFDLLKMLNDRMTIVVVSHDVGFISHYVDRVACINRTLVCHHTDDIDGGVITDLYGEAVRQIAHHHH